MFYLFSVGVHVLVQDVNEYAPEWIGQQVLDQDDIGEPKISASPSTLRVEVEEGQLLEHIIQVEAVDRDCSARFGDVCGYEILQTSASDDNDEKENRQPFTINSEGKFINEILYILTLHPTHQFLFFFSKTINVWKYWKKH